MYYNGSLINSSYYSSNNGGKTVSSKSRWGTYRPYLIEQNDPWDDSTKKIGHGVGLSQNGIKNAALSGVSYKDMLSFYYPGTYIVNNYGNEEVSNTMLPLSVDKLISEFQIMYKEHWSYIWGHHEKGCVDCSGAFYYVFHKYGLPMYNGSNRIARVYIKGNLISYSEAKSKNLIIPGMAAFKCRKPSDKNYSLGSGYKVNGSYYNGDLNDYYHIGLVDSDIEYVLNAQGSKTGFTRSNISQNWSHVAYMKNIEYDGGSDFMETTTMTVIRTDDTSSSTKTVNMRSSASTMSSVIAKINFGNTVQAISTEDEWTKIEYLGKTGYMMSKFLQKQDNILTNSITITEEQLTNLTKAYEYIGNIINK